MTAPTRLAALLQLASPALPVGAFSYSQGLEAAIDAGAVRDAASARTWILDHAELVLGRWELPLWLRLHAAFAGDDIATAGHLNELLIAARDTREARAETLQMGHSLHRLLVQLGLDAAAAACTAAAAHRATPDPAPAAVTPATAGGHDAGVAPPALAYPTAHAAACVALGIGAADGALAALYAAVENQVMAALKAVPLGQADGQRLLLAAHPVLARTVAAAQAMGDDDLAASAPLLAIAGARHETQYSRLFRS